jgi:hypothetical protein
MRGCSSYELNPQPLDAILTDSNAIVGRKLNEKFATIVLLTADDIGTF